jgi:microcystin-dependent protein
MSWGTSNRDGGKTSESGHLRIISKIITGNVVTGLGVVQRAAGANMSVDIGIGDGIVMRSDGVYGHQVFNDAVENKTVTTADGSNPRRDIVVAYIDYGETPSTLISNNTNGVVKSMIVAGTPAGSPTDPSDAAIQSAVGSGNPWFKLARVRVPAGQTSITNTLIDDLRAFAGAKDQPGVVKDFAGTVAPAGYILLYGQTISRTTYADLFAVIGTTYGVGDGSTTFTLPDARGRVVAGKDDMGGSSANRLTNQTGGLNGNNLGATGGAETHVLLTAQMPSHTHSLGGGQNQWVRGGTGDTPANLNQGGSAFRVQMVTPTDATGGDGAHNNVQPTIIFNKIIAY